MNDNLGIDSKNHGGTAAAGGVSVDFEAVPERRLIRLTGSHRHIVFNIRVGHRLKAAEADRLPLDLALVLDRSGSMEGQKLDTAKRSAMAVLERLDERDTVAVVVFDDQVDVLQTAVQVTRQRKAIVASALAEIRARATTALHEGWLAGCQAIAGDTPAGNGQRLTRCFLLTDGLANVGLTDPEQIAGQAADVYRNAGVGTSTFGFGSDYSEALLGPMAVAGGGQFHHLRTLDDITSTFVGELGDLFDVALARTRLEMEMSPGVLPEMISQFRASEGNGAARWSVALGDLLAGDERHVVVRFSFPGRPDQREMLVRARLVWEEAGAVLSTSWQEVWFTFADQASCNGEAYDPSAAHWMGLHHAERSKRKAAVARRPLELDEARRDLAGVAERIRRYADVAPTLVAVIADLETMRTQLAERPLDSMESKEVFYHAQLSSRGQKDHRKK